MKTRKILSSLLALVLIAALLTSSAFAATWYLENGDITVSADENGQTVKQGDNDAVADNDVTITQRDSSTATSNTITISTTGDAEAEITIKDININSGSLSAIDVGDSNLHLTVEGDNTLTADGDSAALHVSSGNLTIDGDGSLTARHDGRDGLEQDSAKIGSNAGEDMTGNIHITGDVAVATDGSNFVSLENDIEVTPDKNYRYITSSGAGIGAGAVLVGKDENGVYCEGGAMSGTITIDGNAKVDASSGSLDGAGIGTGYGYLLYDSYNSICAGGEMSGTITIGGSAEVTASCEKQDSYPYDSGEGAGIGTGAYGNMTGDIVIGGSANVTSVSNHSGAGIGAGDSGMLTDTAAVTIGGNADVFAFCGSHDTNEGHEGRMYGSGAGIGTGVDGGMNGTVNIWGNAKVTAVSAKDGSGIGSGDSGKMHGTVNITDNANVTAVSGRYASGIGAGDSSGFFGRIIISGNASVIARAGSGNTDIDSDPVPPYLIAAAIGGAKNSFNCDGRILILGSARVTTGVINKYSATPENPTGKLLDSLTGYIGNENDPSDGLVFISDTASVNGVPGTDTDGINAYINGGNGTDLIPAQMEVLPDGGMRLVIEKEGYTVSDALYGGNKELPTAPGVYPITVTVTMGEESFDVVLGTIVIPEPEPEPEPEPKPETKPETEAGKGVYVPLYRVTDMAGKELAYEKELSDGVLTLTVKADEAKLILRRGALDTLRAQGVEKFVFVTNGARSAFTTADAAALGSGELVLTHSGTEVSATLAGKALDTAALLIKE